MKKAVAAIVLAALAIFCAALFFHVEKKPGAIETSAPAPEAGGRSNNPSLQTAAAATIPAGQPAAAATNPAAVMGQPMASSVPGMGTGVTYTNRPEFTNIPPDAVMGALKNTFVQYTSMFGGNPVGNNDEITAALAGKNPRQANFINAEAGMRINSKGELVDVWGTPYFFHQLSGKDMEIHSAGPDKIMWTSDDIVVQQ